MDESDLAQLISSIEGLSKSIRTSVDPGVSIQGWVLTGIILLSAFVALYSLISQRISDRRRVTYEYMLRVRTADDYMAGEEAFLDLAESGNLFSVIDPPAENLSKSDLQQREKTNSV